MIRSMTGYGRSEKIAHERKVVVELSSINHRYLDLNIRMPRTFAAIEENLRSRVKSCLSRGKVEMNLMVQTNAPEDMEVQLNENLAQAYVEGLRSLAKELDLEDNLKITDVMQIPEVVMVQKRAGDLEAVKVLIEEALSEALDELINMRKREGENLKKDILLKAAHLEELVSRAEKQAPKVVSSYKTKLEMRLKMLLNNIPVDENRLATEVAVFADKCAVDEEIIRLKSHIMQLRGILEAEGAVGRKLDFLMQEMNREANTIGSKANDYEMTQIVVELKNEIEKIREQVQNIE